MKRFTETDKWTKDKWFRKLIPEYKLFWLYLIDQCDSVGVWEEDIELAGLLIGYTYTIDNLMIAFEGKLHIFDDGKKWWLKKFCDFQHGFLDEESQSKPIMSYISLLKKHTLWIEYTKSIDTLQGKGKGKGKGKGSYIKEEDKEFNDNAETLYLVYPTHVSKPGALRAITKALKKVSFEILLEKTKQYADVVRWAVGTSKQQMIPHPATWFNNDRWENDPSTWEISKDEQESPSKDIMSGVGSINQLMQKEA